MEGFTLVEMLVVLAVIGIVTAAILPEMRGTYNDALLRSASRQLVDAFYVASSRAISRNEPERIVLDPRTGKFLTEERVRETARGDEFGPVRDIPGTQGQLDRRVHLETRAVEEEQLTEPGEELEPTAPPEPRTAGETVVRFYPDGTADAWEFQLTDTQGFRLLLKLNPATAGVRVEELGRGTQPLVE